MHAAIKRGDLVNPGVCEQCQSTAYVEGHHDDYSKPLDVRWLCKSCHRLWHVKNGEGKNADVGPTPSDCEQCGNRLPSRSRSDRKFCSSECRKAARAERNHHGLVASFRRLKTGKMSLVIHLDTDIGLKPGDQVAVAELEED